jgi:hypothetical protein
VLGVCPCLLIVDEDKGSLPCPDPQEAELEETTRGRDHDLLVELFMFALITSYFLHITIPLNDKH